MPYRHAGLILGSVATENSRVARVDRADPRGVAAHARRRARARPSCDDAKAYLAGVLPAQPRLDLPHRRAAGRSMQTDKLGIDYLDRRAALIEASRSDQARGVARRLFDPARLSFAVVGDPADLNPTRPARQPAE